MIRPAPFLFLKTLIFLIFEAEIKATKRKLLKNTPSAWQRALKEIKGIKSCCRRSTRFTSNSAILRQGGVSSIYVRYQADE